jgi:hypothetical protein
LHTAKLTPVFVIAFTRSTTEPKRRSQHEKAINRFLYGMAQRIFNR